ncbi:protein clustered with O-phosphoseryl-tRNA(Cys) synthetase [Methanosarcina sp. KYL-1]|uniref:DUF169 domain-containing protein n=1 Tax=Methanosarcina sp. KYL-1 TaxID=2602068 RepID=UPI002100FD95|nr:DUF169 domain-containing protein [Methanosarcina sp. KYL-1]MCQ1536013.1 protein clustered with O-phosphoseryl-tRNA(Cys) synthetase [Methanosarcina sp. KYL-1]
MQSEQNAGLRYPELSRLMEAGEPVCVTFETGEGNGEWKPAEGENGKKEAARFGSGNLPEKSGLLFCELVHKARFGETFRVSGQGCSPGNYVLGLSEESPAAYYLKSGRYRDPEAAEKAALSLPRLKKEFCSIRVEPLSWNRENFDVLILFLKPEKAMRIVQAQAYPEGKRAVLDTMGAASVCGDCTALAVRQGLGLSFGCKGSRKHSGYEDFELPLGISFEKVEEIEEGLSKLPDTRA